MRLHRQLGQWKEEQYGTKAALIAEELAGPFHGRAGLPQGGAVSSASGNASAASVRASGSQPPLHGRVEAAGAAPRTPERNKQELVVHDVSSALIAIHSYASSELEQNLARAHALCQDLNDPAALAPVLAALTRLYMARADRTKTEAFFELQRQLLLRSAPPADAILLHTQMGTVELWRGAHARSQEHHIQALELYDAPAHRSLFLTFGVDPKCITLASYGWSLCLSGWPEQAWSWERRALEYAEELAHPLSLANTLVFAIFVRCFRHEGDEALLLAQQFRALRSEQGLGVYLGGANCS